MSRAGVRLLEEADIQAIRMRQVIFNPQPALAHCSSRSPVVRLTPPRFGPFRGALAASLIG